MSLKKIILILIFIKSNFIQIQSKETNCFINGQKPLNVVNERFISISIDPSILLAGFNLSSTSLQLAQHLSPAFIRIAGPSTQLLKFSDDVTLKSLLEGTSNFTVTPMMWKSLNYWIKKANLTPVFAISDQNRTDGFWNPTSALPLLELSGKMNLSCYWQLGYDCKDKSIIRYKHDLFTLKQALKEYSSNMKYWKIVGSDLQHCLARKNPDLAKKTLHFLDDVTDAVIWQEPFWKNPTNFPATSTPIWLVVPERTQRIRFAAGLIWAKQIGEAAKSGYEVIFRQPSLQELSDATSVYWISLIYKSLMGRNVLEIRSNSIAERNVNIYANCAKNQDNYAKQGAVSIFIINNSTEQHVTSLRTPSSYQASIEVHSYVITSDGEDSADTYLNGKKLNFRDIQEGDFELRPTLRRVRVNRALNLVSPPKSVAIFVLPSAKIPVCIKNEKETQVLMKELGSEQRINHPELPQEVLKAQIPEEYGRKLHQNVKLEVLTERTMMNQTVQTNMKTVDEIKKILKERANLKVPEAESHDVEERTETRKKKRFAALNILRKFNKAKKVIKRDINMKLLELQTPTVKKPSMDSRQIQATIRKSGETSAELLEAKSEELADVYAELADSSLEKHDEGIFGTQETHNQKLSKEKLCPGAKYLDERVQFLMEPSGLETFLHEDLNDYHGLHENVRFQKMANPKTQFNNEIPPIEEGKVIQPSKMEIGELYSMGRRNQDVEGEELYAAGKQNYDFGTNGDAAKMVKLPPLVMEKPDEWYEMARQNYGLGENLDDVKMETERPEFNIEGRERYVMGRQNHDFETNRDAVKLAELPPLVREKPDEWYAMARQNYGLKENLDNVKMETEKSEFNIEGRERDAMGRQNHDFGTNRDAVKMEELPPHVREKPNEWYETGRQNYDFEENLDGVKIETNNPEFNVEERERYAMERQNYDFGTNRDPVKMAELPPLVREKPDKWYEMGRQTYGLGENLGDMKMETEKPEFNIKARERYAMGIQSQDFEANRDAIKMVELPPLVREKPDEWYKMGRQNYNFAENLDGVKMETQKPEFNVEGREQYAMERQNEDFEPNLDVVKMEELPPFVREKPDKWYEMGRQNYDFAENFDAVKMETEKPKFNVDGRERYAMEKQNHDFGTNRDAVKMAELPPLVREKPDKWYEMGRQNYDFGENFDTAEMETEKPQFNVEGKQLYAMERQTDDFGPNRDVVPPPVREKPDEWYTMGRQNYDFGENIDAVKTETEKPEFKGEGGEWYTMQRQNHDSGTNQDILKMAELAPLIKEKPDDEWYDMGRQSYEFGSHLDTPKMETEKSKLNVKGTTKEGKITGESENNGKQFEEVLGKYVFASPQIKMTWKHENYGSMAHASTIAVEEMWKTTTEAQTPPKLEPWIGRTANSPKISINHEFWDINSNPQVNAEIPPIFTTTKPQPWEEKSFFDMKENIVRSRPQIYQDVWQMDMLPRIGDDKLETSANSGEVSTASNTIWEDSNNVEAATETVEKSSSVDEVNPWITNQTNVSELNKSLEDFLNLPETASREKFAALAEKTFKDIENFFYDAKTRIKREDSNITKDDIKNYRKFMNEQLRVLKKSRQGGEPPTTKPKLRINPKKDDALSSSGEHLHLVFGKPFNREKLHINERRRAKQEQILKQRVQNRKKLEKLREKKEENEGLSRRRKRSPYNTQTNEVSDKKLAKPYTRRIFGPRTWQPQDISTVKKIPSYSIEVVDKREFSSRTAPFIKRTERSLDDSSENAIIDDYDIFKNPETVTHPPNQTEKPDKPEQKEDETLDEHHFMNMLMDAVNTTITTFVHLTEKIGKQFSF